MEETFQYERLKQLRLEKGKTIEELAARIKTTKSAISRWETGERVPRPRFVKALTKVFGVERSYFFVTVQTGK